VLRGSSRDVTSLVLIFCLFEASRLGCSVHA
jgi:hypothetical protein